MSWGTLWAVTKPTLYHCKTLYWPVNKPRLWLCYLLVSSCSTTKKKEKQASGLVVNITTLEILLMKTMICLPTNLPHTAGCHPTKNMSHQLIAGWVLTFAHNNTPYGQHL